MGNDNESADREFKGIVEIIMQLTFHTYMHALNSSSIDSFHLPDLNRRHLKATI